MMILTPILVLLAIMSRLDTAAPAGLRPERAALLSLVLILGPSLMTWPLVGAWQRAIDRTGSWRLIARTGRLLAIEQLSAGLLTAGAIAWLGWLDAVRTWLGDRVLIDEAVACAPWAIATAVIAAQSHGLERRLRGAMLVRELDEGAEITPMHGLPAWIGLRLREVMSSLIAPGMLFLLWIEGAGALALGADRYWPGVFVTQDAMGRPVLTGASEAAVAIGMLGLALLAPAMLARVMPTTSVKSGRLVEIVAAVCASSGLRTKRVRIWRPSFGQANAMVMGVLPGTREILVSERLIAGLDEPMLAAVVAHEVGHIKRRHIPWTCAAVMGTSLGVQAVGVATGAASGFGAEVFVAIAIVVGLVSRRFEAQADVFAARTLERMGMDRAMACGSMIAALGRVAALNRVSVRRRDYLHGSIAARMERLRAMLGDDGTGERVDRTARWTKVVIGLGLTATVAGWVWVG